MKFKVQMIEDFHKINIEKLTAWFYETWGKDDGFSPEKSAQFMQYSFNKNRLPKTFVAFDENGQEVGMCQLTMHDVISRPDIYPFLANLYVVPEHRKKGIARALNNELVKTAKKEGLTEIFLYTPLDSFYEKLGWKYVEDIKTFCTPNVQRLYKYDLTQK